MAEPVIKKRVLTKVRSQFLHKRPPNEDEVTDALNLTVTPEQLNENSTRLLESSFSLVETNRTICASSHFLNLHYKIVSFQVERQLQSQTVTLNLQSNGVDILPWEYCVKRLESYGDLELATWASRLKEYHKGYSEKMTKYYEAVKSTDPVMIANMAKSKQEMILACRAIEIKCIYRKLVLYANQSSLVPVSVTFHEEILKDIGHSVEGFVEWTKEHGIPALFKKDSVVLLEQYKQCLSSGGGKASMIQERPECTVEIHTKEGEKKSIKIKTFLIVNPAPEGLLVNIYSIRVDPETNEVPSEKGENSECKEIKLVEPPCREINECDKKRTDSSSAMITYIRKKFQLLSAFP